jgi:hypothetical protein
MPPSPEKMIRARKQFNVKSLVLESLGLVGGRVTATG